LSAPSPERSVGFENIAARGREIRRSLQWGPELEALEQEQGAGALSLETSRSGAFHKASQRGRLKKNQGDSDQIIAPILNMEYRYRKIIRKINAIREKEEHQNITWEKQSARQERQAKTSDLTRDANKKRTAGKHGRKRRRTREVQCRGGPNRAVKP